MKQQAAAPKTSTETSTATAAQTPKAATATPTQDTLGNSALQASVAAPAEEGSSLLAEEASPQSAVTDMHSDPHVKHGTTDKTKAKSTSTATNNTIKPDDTVSRPAKFKKGMNGALIGGASIQLTSDPGKGSTVATVSDGQPAKIEQIGAGDFLQVSVRQGSKNVKGWISAALFSDQPALAKDEDDPSLRQDLQYKLIEGDLSPEGQKDKKAPTTQGALGDCYFISSMAAIHFSNPDFAKRMIKYDAKRKKYTVTFYQDGNAAKPVEVEVDGYLPMEKSASGDPAYAGDPNDAMWGAIVEKAYAKWKGGYDKIEGGDGGTAMAELTGGKSDYKDTGAMKEEDVIPYFQNAQKNGLAIYAGTISSVKVDKQTPLSGSASGPYTGTLSQQHSWNEIEANSLHVVDTGAKVAEAHDVGVSETKSGKIIGADVKTGEVGYKDNTVKVEYKTGKAPKTAKDLEVHFETHGVLNPSKMVIGDHGYAFSGVVSGGKELQMYNPWGSYQPKPITPKEFLTYYDSLSVNHVPAGKTGGK